MAVPLIQQLRVGSYILRQRLKGIERYPLVLMLEPLFRCNLACPGCGKIDYEEEILNRRLSLKECLAAVDECGAPIVSIPGGEPLLHREMPEIVKAIVGRKKFVYLCTNALLLEKKLDQFEPSPFLTFSVHLDGLEKHHDHAVAQEGVFKRAVSAIRKAKEMGFRVNVNCTLFDQMTSDEIVEFFDFACNDLGVEGITVSPGYAYERAPDQEHFLNREKTKLLFRDVFGWQRPCYLLGEGYANSFKELMEDTEWAKYGTGNYEKCADCMVHCGYEPTAVMDTVAHPLKALKVALVGVNTEKPMAPEISLENQRPADFIFDEVVAERLEVEAERSDAA
jgi:hopanoid biosynthesis associated radical SAM protein HpnH